MTLKQRSAKPFRQVSPDLIWSVEATSTLVVNRRTNETSRLDYPEAAVWDLLQRPYSENRIVHLLAAIIHDRNEVAEVLLGQCIDTWSDRGWLPRPPIDD